MQIDRVPTLLQLSMRAISIAPEFRATQRRVVVFCPKSHGGLSLSYQCSEPRVCQDREEKL